MHLALYGEGGFYSSGGAAGRRGDFITSPEVGPLFGAVLARMLDHTWRSLGEPDVFTVVDAGAGPGTLARTIRAARPACADAMDYVAVEVSERQREAHPDWVRSVAEMPTGPITGVIVANELLDNMAFRLFVNDSGWREAHVVAQPDGSFGEILCPAGDREQLRLPTGVPHGARVPVQQSAAAWTRSAIASLVRGHVLVVDYATITTADFASRPWRQWLRTYRGHQRGDHYLSAPGTQDITVEIAIDQLISGVHEQANLGSQRQFLHDWGIDELVAEGQREWEAHAARPTVAALTMRSRVREADALCDEAGLGSFSVIEFQQRR